jgi:hypothetical protein
MQVIRLTIREAAAAVQRQHGGRVVPDWKLRRVVDCMEVADQIEVQRVGTYRTISSDDIGKIADELQRLGWLTQREPVTC